MRKQLSDSMEQSRHSSRMLQLRSPIDMSKDGKQQLHQTPRKEAISDRQHYEKINGTAPEKSIRVTHVNLMKHAFTGLETFTI